MKKVLLATSALVATAGVAAADVNLSGLARFGVLYTEGAAQETRAEHRFRLNVDGSAEADGGLTFGARIRMQADDGATAAGTLVANAPRFSVSAGGLSVGVGNIWGAIDSMPGLYGGTVGLSGLGFSNVVTNFGSDTYDSTGAGRNGVEVIYSAGDLGVHVSNSTSGAIDRTAIAASYAVSGWTVALGYQDSSVATDAEWVVTAGGKVGAASVGFAMAQANNGNNSMTLSASVAAGAATTVSMYVASDEGQADQNAFGLGVVHNLGGGASLRGGFASTHGTNRADLGVQFNF
jgi:outer membrane protein OmpU